MLYLINRYRFLFLFVLLICFCFFKSMNVDDLWGRLNDLAFIGLMILSILLIGHQEKWLLTSLFLVTGVQLLLLVFHALLTPDIANIFNYLLGSCFFLVMMVACIYYTFQDETIGVTTLFGSISAYLLLGLMFAYVFNWLEMMSPGSFEIINAKAPTDAIYYSFVTMTTLGFGDIIPVTPLAKTLTWFEAFFGQCYMAVIIGQLIGRYVADIKKA